ncbi:Mss4-like protein [Tricladium varicosporioides]|nr:Mss4-like protein [Hymenoscyphus varicosporioides]
MASTPALMGSCQCGHVTYSSASLPTYFSNCYCTTCRRLSGAPFVTFAQFLTKDITWTSGKDSLTTRSYSQIAERCHCAECGSLISMQFKCEQEFISISVGTFNEDSIKGKLPEVTAHIFVESMGRASGYKLPDDNVPKYAKFTTSFQKRLDNWKNALIVDGPGLG